MLSVDPQASAVWWSERVDGLPFDFDQVHDQPQLLPKLKTLTQYQHIFIDTPGSLENEHLLSEALAYADDVIVPLPPEPLAYDACKRTITQVLKPRGLTYRVVINDWDPRDGIGDRDDTATYIDSHGWPRTNAVIRRYKIHTNAAAAGRVVTQYPKNRVSMEARQDFYRLALELGYGRHDDQQPRIHVVCNQKGGVGKTTTTVNLAAVVSETLTGGAA